jgi:hypothetical protein
MNKPQDTKADTIVFGVELETFIPDTCGVTVGNYHGGTAVATGSSADGSFTAPTFGNTRWRAERDGSIRADSGHTPCEFVSPKLSGAHGLEALDQFVGFAKSIGGKVNGSCGCHVTVGIPSVIGSHQSADIAHFIQKLVRLADFHAWAIYAQTGTSRHTNTYCPKPNAKTGEATNDLVMAEKNGDGKMRQPVTWAAGRGMVNLNKAFPSNLRDSAVEFRAFAGTLNRWKVMHHVATCLGLMRKAHEARHVPHYGQKKKPANATEAMFRMYKHLGWLEDEACGDVPLGVFGLLHQHFNQHTATALKLAEKFERKFPQANL